MLSISATTTSYCSFERKTFFLCDSPKKLKVILCHPPGNYADFSEFLCDLVFLFDKIVMVEDFFMLTLKVTVSLLILVTYLIKLGFVNN